MAFAPVLAGIGIAASVASAATSAIGAETQAQSQANMYNYQAGVAQVNAQIAKQDANYATATGEVQAQQSGLRTAAEVGATKAGFGASNISLNGGSAGRVLSSETAIGQENQSIIRADAAKRAYGFKVGAAEDVAQAGAYGTAATNSLTAGNIGATSSILGGVGSVASKWLQASQSGAFSPTNSGAGVNPDSAYGQSFYSNSIFN